MLGRNYVHYISLKDEIKANANNGPSIATDYFCSTFKCVFAFKILSTLESASFSISSDCYDTNAKRVF